MPRWDVPRLQIPLAILGHHREGRAERAHDAVPGATDELADQEKNGHWFPCQVAGTRDFGGMAEFRPILQKGDNFYVPEQRKEGRQHYAAEFLKADSLSGIGKPTVIWVKELLPAD